MTNPHRIFDNKACRVIERADARARQLHLDTIVIRREGNQMWAYHLAAGVCWPHD